MSAIRVAVTDIETGEVNTIEVPDHEYFLVTTGGCYVANTQVYPQAGTHVLTIKGRRPTPTKEETP